MSAFGLGVVQGFATSTDAALKEHIKANKDRFNKNLEAALSRNLERSTRYDKDTREANEALELMAGFTNGDLGDATAAIKGLGGYKQVKGFVDAFRIGLQTNKDLKFSDAVTFAADNPELTSQQALRQLVTPLEFTIPAVASKQKNWYQKLTADPRSMAVELPRILRERGITSTQADKLIKLQGAQVNWGMLRTPEQQFAMQKRKAELANLEGINTARDTAIKISNQKFDWMDADHERDIQKFTATMADQKVSTAQKAAALEITRTYGADKARSLIEASVASSIASKSSDDMAEQYNMLGAEERYYNDQLSQQEDQSNKWYQTARRLTDIRLARKDLVAKGFTTLGDDTFSNVSVVSAANAIKADAVRDAGLRYKLDRFGRMQLLKGGTADKIYQASRNAYLNFKDSFGQSSASQVTQQLAAMQKSMYNAQSTYVSNAVNKHFKNIKPIKASMTDDERKNLVAANKKIHDTLPKSHTKKTFTRNDGSTFQSTAPNMGLLNTLKPGTLVLINSQEALKENWDDYKESGNFAIWDGFALIQRKRGPNEQQMPTYNPAQSAFSR